VANSLSHTLTLDDAYTKNQHGFGNVLHLSDHYAFYEKGIPVIGFFSGLHHDYHTAFDTADKIEYEEMWRRTQLIFTTLFLAADEDVQLKK
jgi:Zn-dependent M28 family amino/carboxypeptidase